MAALLDRISGRSAWILVGAGLAFSLAAAALSPQDTTIGAWVRPVVWHGMLTVACVAVVFLAGILGIAHLISGKRSIASWARALQVTLLPAWAFAVLVGAVSAKLVWNSWNLAERRMTMSLVYTVVAAIALVVALSLEDRRVASWSQVATAIAMGAGLVWIALGPAGDDVHPASAVLSSGDVAFKVYALLMMGGCLVALLAAAVLVRRWIERGGGDASAPDPEPAP